MVSVLHGAETHNQAVSDLVWFCGYARTLCRQFLSCFVLCCDGQCIEWLCISGIVLHDFDDVCQEEPDDIQLHVFDVARVECEVYLMEATQNLGEQDLRLSLLQLQFVVGAFPRPTRLIPHLC